MKVTLYIANIQANHFIEDLESYLMSQEKIELNEDYETRDFLEDNLSIYLKIATNDSTKNNKGWNYLKCQSDDKTRYYYIDAMKWLNDGTIAISGTMDVVNSFQEIVSKESNFHHVKMQRCHKDRMVKTGYRIFDVVDEGFQPDVFETTSDAIGDNNRSYILYKQDTSTDSGYVKSPSSQLRKLWYAETSQAVTMDQYKAELNWSLGSKVGETTTYLIVNNTFVSLSYNPRVLMVSPSGLTVRINKPDTNQYSIFCDAVMLYPEINSGKNQLKFQAKFFKNDNGYLTYISGATYDYGTRYQMQFYGLEEWDAYIDLLTNASYPSLTANNKYIPSELVQLPSLSTIGASSVTPTATSLSMVNKSNSELKQITEIPFIPSPSSLCYLGGDNNEIGVKANADLLFKSEQEIIINEWQNVTIPTDTFITRDKKYESKLYGSYCRNYYLNYDNATLVLQPERWQRTTPKVTSYAPCDFSNNLGFRVYGFSNQTEYDNWLLTSRNNNIQVNNDDYLEYIRTGYNYDIKSKNIQTIKDWTGFGVGLGNAVSSGTFGFASRRNSESLNASLFLGQSAVNAGIGAVGNIINNITNQISNNDSLNRRKQDAMNATVNISGNDNLALFHKYNQSTGLRLNKTQPHSYVEDSEFDLFYYYGYADNKTYDVLPTIKTRKFFNYIQAEIGYIVPQEGLESRISDAITSAYATGITFEWNYNNKYLNEGTLYENFEIWI